MPRSENVGVFFFYFGTLVLNLGLAQRGLLSHVGLPCSGEEGGWGKPRREAGSQEPCRVGVAFDDSTFMERTTQNPGVGRGLRRRLVNPLSLQMRQVTLGEGPATCPGVSHKSRAPSLFSTRGADFSSSERAAARVRELGVRRRTLKSQRVDVLLRCVSRPTQLIMYDPDMRCHLKVPFI